jgi:hypothetical protein
MSDEENKAVPEVTTEGDAPAAEPDASNEVAPEEAPAGDTASKAVAPPSEEGVQWVAASAGTVPEGALKGGEDNGNVLYVARAEHEEAVIPGKLLADHGVAYIPWGGEEHSKEAYEVLVIAEDAVSWVDGTGDTIPENAIRGGTSADGEALYIGRATHEGSQTIGKVHPSHGCLYISYGGAEINYPEYQILVKN